MTITIVFPAQHHVLHDEHGWPRNGFKNPETTPADTRRAQPEKQHCGQVKQQKRP
jgi:hypothetical protein